MGQPVIHMRSTNSKPQPSNQRLITSLNVFFSPEKMFHSDICHKYNREEKTIATYISCWFNLL